MSTLFKFIHCADLHLGAPFKYLTSLGKIGDEAVIEATYRAFGNVVDVAISEDVDAMLIAGDIYNSKDHNLVAQIRFVKELNRLQEANIQVYIVHGNHDPLESWQAKVALPPNVHIFSGNDVEAKSLLVKGKEVATIYGMSHANYGITENLAARFRRKTSDRYAIGLLHAAVGSVAGVDQYAPCALDDLCSAQMDYWALGHIHKRAVLAEEPYIVYPGNTQGLHRRENGAKGCYLVTVDSSYKTTVKFVETNAIRFEEEQIDITPLKQVEDIVEMIRHKKEMIRHKYKTSVLLHLILVGEGELSVYCRDEEARKLWLTEGQGEVRGKANFVIPYELTDQTRLPLNLQERQYMPDVLGDYLRAVDKILALPEQQQVTEIMDYLEARPEMKRLQSYRYLLDEKLLTRAVKRAQKEGALCLWGEDYES